MVSADCLFLSYRHSLKRDDRQEYRCGPFSLQHITTELPEAKKSRKIISKQWRFVFIMASYVISFSYISV